MKLRYRLFLRRKNDYYAFDDSTKTFTSLKTKDKAEANRLLAGCHWLAFVTLMLSALFMKS
jgi:hypothetical protein